MVVSVEEKEPQVLHSIKLRFMLDHARVVAKDDKETNTISAGMPRRMLRDGEVSTLKPLVLTSEVGLR